LEKGALVFAEIMRGRKVGYLLILPAVAGLFLFIMFPFGQMVISSFSDQRLISPYETEFVGFRNYERLLGMKLITMPANASAEDATAEAGVRYQTLRKIIRSDPEYQGYRRLGTIALFDQQYVFLAQDPVFIQSLWNTLLFVLAVVPLQVGLSLLMALLINADVKGKIIFRTVYFTPVVTSMVVVSLIWIFLLNKDYGLINTYLETLSFGLIEPIDWLGNPEYALIAIVVVSAWQGAGFQMLIFLAGLQSIPTMLYEAASLDGASKWNQFRYVTLPGLKNTITFVVISTSIAAFGLFTQVHVMTSGGPVNSTSTVMYHVVKKGFKEQDIAYGSAISVIYFLIILAISFAQKTYFERQENR